MNANWLALALSALFLCVYFTGAIISSLTLGPEGKTRRSFNLGLPITSKPGELFAISLVSAATSLSTVFVAFLTAPATWGLHLLICPVTFAAGTLLSIHTYRRILRHGYLDEPDGSGLLPRFAYVFTGSRAVAVLVALASVLPIAAILVLELHFGVHLFDDLLKDATGQRVGLATYATFLILLLGYVFVGGFRAVVTSDVWQYRTLKVGIGIAFAGWLAAALYRPTPWTGLRDFAGSASQSSLVAFYVTVSVINLFVPMCLATSWQRFYAFRTEPIDYREAGLSAVWKLTTLWVGIIGVGLLAGSLSPPPDSNTTAADAFFAVLRGIKGGPGVGLAEWFKYFVFPLLIAAAFSGMYSSSDTCVSALLYLVEAREHPNRGASRPLGRSYYVIMASIFLFCIVTYELTFKVGDLVTYATAIFGNATLIAPTVLLISFREPGRVVSLAKRRKLCIVTSIIAGFVVHWSLFSFHSQGGVSFTPWRPWAAPLGLIAAAAPVVLLLWIEWRTERKDGADV